MDKIEKALNNMHEINAAYELSNEMVENTMQEIDAAKVCTPVIGKFSSGKSALINTVLGYTTKLLREDITPETAVPAEIVYSNLEDIVALYKNDGTQLDVEVSEFRKLELDANTVRRVRLNLNNSFLEEIPDVMLVDMPGFESGLELHNRVIDDYLPQSLAYIVAFPADDMVVRSSVGNILKELCLYDMPLCVVITKYDKRNDDFDETFEKMKESLKRFVGERQITYCITSSFTGDTEELKEFLKEIQMRSQELLENKFKNMVIAIMDNTESYLKTILKNNEMTESELDEEEEKLGRQLNSLDDKFLKEKEDFNLQIAGCVEEIKADIQTALETEESAIIAMVLNRQNPDGYINNLVRNAAVASVKRRLLPKMERYLKRVSDSINADSLGDVRVNLNVNIEDMDKGLTSSVAAVAAGFILGFPLLGLLAAFLLNKSKGDKKREEAKEQVRMKLHSEVYPQVMKEVGNNLKQEVAKQVTLVNTSIEEEIQTQRGTLEKAMSDLRNRINDEKVRKENMAIDINNDLERVGEIRNGL